MKTVDYVREGLVSLREKREKIKTLDKEVKEAQPELIALMVEVDPEGDGIVVDPDDKVRGTAFVQQNKGTDVWDEDAIITWLKKDKRRWQACSSRVLDIRKFEAEVANGNVPKKTAKRLMKTTPPPKPFIRFGKSKDGSK